MTSAPTRVHHWTTDYFREGYLESLPPAYGTTVAEEQVQELVRLLMPPSGGMLLDVPSGNGRLTIPLARLGYDVVAVDHNPMYLKRASLALKQEGLHANLIEDDMYRLTRIAGTFDGALCYGSALGYHGETEDIALFTRVRACLKPGGHFVIETDGYEWLMGQAPARHWYANPNGWYSVAGFLERDLHAGRIRMEHHFINADLGRRETAVVDCLLYSLKDLTRLLNAAGFNVLATEDGTGKAYTARSPKLVVLAQKSD